MGECFTLLKPDFCDVVGFLLVVECPRRTGNARTYVDGPGDGLGLLTSGIKAGPHATLRGPSLGDGVSETRHSGSASDFSHNSDTGGG
mgnify:CR=1 FL=1